MELNLMCDPNHSTDDSFEINQIIYSETLFFNSYLKQYTLPSSLEGEEPLCFATGVMLVPPALPLQGHKLSKVHPLKDIQ